MSTLKEKSQLAVDIRKRGMIMSKVEMNNEEKIIMFAAKEKITPEELRKAAKTLENNPMIEFIMNDLNVGQVIKLFNIIGDMEKSEE